MSHTERIVGDPKGITRRDCIKGVLTAIGAVVLSSAIGTFAITTFDRAKVYITRRIGGLYAQDASMTLRVSHKNPEIITLYEEFLSPGQVLPATTELSHRLLHTVYGGEVNAHRAELQSVSIDRTIEETVEFMAGLDESADTAEVSTTEETREGAGK